MVKWTAWGVVAALALAGAYAVAGRDGLLVIAVCVLPVAFVFALGLIIQLIAGSRVLPDWTPWAVGFAIGMIGALAYLASQHSGAAILGAVLGIPIETMLWGFVAKAGIRSALALRSARGGVAVGAAGDEV